MSVLLENLLYEFNVNAEIIALHFFYKLFYYHVYDFGFECSVFDVLHFVYQLHNSIGYTWIISEFHHFPKQLWLFGKKLVYVFAFYSHNGVQDFGHIVYAILIQVLLLDI